MILRKCALFFLLIGLQTFSRAQLPPTIDSIQPRKHTTDTATSNVKLQGGALIDTINTKEYRLRHRNQILTDTIKPDSSKH